MSNPEMTTEQSLDTTISSLRVSLRELREPESQNDNPQETIKATEKGLTHLYALYEKLICEPLDEVPQED